MDTTLRLLLGFSRRYPLTRGRDFFFRNFARTGVLREHLAKLPNPQFARRGFPIFCNPRDRISDWIKLWGEYERVTERFLLDASARGGTVLDIGANVGYFSLLIAHEFSDRCHVIAFEPNPPIFQLLQSGARASRGAASLQPVPLAVSDCAGELEFVIDTQNTGHSHLAGTGETGATATVRVVVLDEWLKQNPPPTRIVAVKLDVEGCEVKALRGMERTLREHKPSIVVEVIEGHLRSFGDSINGLKSFLGNLGYSLEDAVSADGNLYLRGPEP